MKDLQTDVAEYYAATAKSTDLGKPVRRMLVTAQRLNDLCCNAIKDKKSYQGLFKAPAHTGAGLMNAVRYARNAEQHVLTIVEPKEHALFGGMHGMRVYAVWKEVPSEVHEQLKSRTQELKPDYEESLLGREVTETMLGVLRFFSAIAPEIVHRDDQGEWTGFPLKSQPGVLSPRLHPEEPADVASAQEWLDSRRPNGDVRVVCSQVTLNDTCYLCGLTFVGRHSSAPFVERLEQVNRDIRLGFPYLCGDVTNHVQYVTEQSPWPSASQSVFYSDNEVTTWASPIDHAGYRDDWATFFKADFWRNAVTMERAGRVPESAYLVRRARRLNAMR